MQVITEEAVPPKKVLTSETIFKYVNICVTLILLFCVRGYLNFRNFAFEKNLYVFSVDSFVWSLIGFIGIFVRNPLCRSSNTPGHISCATEWKRWSILVTKAKRGSESLSQSLSYQTTLFSIP